MARRWAAKDIDELVALHADDLSFSKIAAQLGERSRQSVISKANRMGLPRRAPGRRLKEDATE